LKLFSALIFVLIVAGVWLREANIEHNIKELTATNERLLKKLEKRESSLKVSSEIMATDPAPDKVRDIDNQNKEIVSTSSSSSQMKAEPWESSTADEKSAFQKRFVETMVFSSIERLIALSEEEKLALREAISETIAAQGGFSEVKAEEVLKPIISEERFLAYQKAEADFRQAMRQERTERDLALLSRKLALTARQEQEVSQIIAKSYDEIEKNEVNYNVSSIRDRRLERLKGELARQSYIEAEIKGVLSEAQYNSYLEHQATSASAQAHNSFINSISK
jgi:hypothetical protein